MFTDESERSEKDLSATEKIRILSERLNMPLMRMANEIGWSRQNLNNKMRRGNLTEKDIQEIAKGFGCEAEVVFTLPNGEKV